MAGRNLCIVVCGSGMSRCGADDDCERGGCKFFFPAGPWSNGCMHHREEFDHHCDNVFAQDAARNHNSAPAGSTKHEKNRGNSDRA
jgi:hypothetical protein